MKIILSAIEPGLADAWERFCGAFECVATHRGSILDLKCDAVVSPAISSGSWMAGWTCFIAYTLAGEFRDVSRR